MHRNSADGLIDGEIDPADVDPKFVDQWQRRSVSNFGGQKLVRFIYLVPSDKSVRASYRTGIETAVSSLQNFYKNELGSGYRFSLHSPEVEVYQSTHNAAYYSTNPNGSQALWFWQNVLSEVFSLTGGGFNDPSNRWIIYIDADPTCGQSIGGTAGVALMAANDLRGLSGEANVPNCTGQSPDNGLLGRWIGGAGHEIGHSFNLPHPPGCGGSGPAYGCTGGDLAAGSLMWVGYAFYPSTYFLAADKTALMATGFFSNNFPLSVSGRVTNAGGRGISGARVTITDQAGVSRFTQTNPFGYFRFPGVIGGQTYILTAGRKSLQFEPSQISPTDNTTVNFTAN